MKEEITLSGAELARRLLGPNPPELSCEQCFEQLDRYVDLSVRGADADALIPGMRAHLQGCPACEEDYCSLRDLVVADEASTAGG